jgi:tRNA A22 N-methylase
VSAPARPADRVNLVVAKEVKAGPIKAAAAKVADRVNLEVAKEVKAGPIKAAVNKIQVRKNPGRANSFREIHAGGSRNVTPNSIRDRPLNPQT